MAGDVEAANARFEEAAVRAGEMRPNTWAWLALARVAGGHDPGELDFEAGSYFDQIVAHLAKGFAGAPEHLTKAMELADSTGDLVMQAVTRLARAVGLQQAGDSEADAVAAEAQATPGDPRAGRAGLGYRFSTGSRELRRRRALGLLAALCLSVGACTDTPEDPATSSSGADGAAGSGTDPTSGGGGGSGGQPDFGRPRCGHRPRHGLGNGLRPRWIALVHRARGTARPHGPRSRRRASLTLNSK